MGLIETEDLSLFSFQNEWTQYAFVFSIWDKAKRKSTNGIALAVNL